MRTHIKVILSATVFLFFAGISHCQEATKPDVQAIINEGVDLYDHREYAKAIEKYTRALELEPGNSTALYERCMTYMTMGEYSKCMEDAEWGFKLRTPIASQFYAVAGSCYSQQGKFDKALEYFKKGLKKFPDDEQLHYNMAIACFRSGDNKGARTHMKKVLEVNPDRASANYSLAQLYEAEGLQVPAIFMYLKFFLSEPYSERTQPAISAMIDLVGKSSAKQKGQNITVYVDVDDPSDEGNWAAVSMMMALSQAISLQKGEKKASEAESLVKTLGSMTEMAETTKDSKLKKTFVYKHAVTTLAAMRKAGVLDVYLYWLMNEVHVDGSAKWLDEHKKEQEDLQKWIADNIRLRGNYFPLQKK